MSASTAINWAASTGIIDGIGGGLFGPDETVTAGLLADVLGRFAESAGAAPALAALASDAAPAAALTRGDAIPIIEALCRALG